MLKRILKIHRKSKSKKLNKTFILIFLLVLNSLLLGIQLLILTGQTKIRMNYQPIEIISDLDYQNKLSPTYFSTYYNERTINSLPIWESSPISNSIYRYEPQEYSIPEKKIPFNPIPLNNFIFKRGQLLFERNCVVCHGYDGRGNGEILTKVTLKEGEEGFPPPKDLTSTTTKEFSDGRMFHILSAGQNLMFSFNDRLNSFDRWCIIHYIRKIQNLQK